MAGIPPRNPFEVPKKADATVTAPSEEEETPCPICLMKPVYPIKLPCNHVFCFLCIKGASLQGPNSRCAICRANIPAAAIANPQVLDSGELQKDPPKAVSGYRWFYQSRAGGWWQYDERAMNSMESAFAANQATCQLLLAGKIFIVDFQQMMQYPQNDPRAFRRIRRGTDVPGNERKGVAGIPTAGSGSGDAGSSPPQASNNNGPVSAPPQN